MARFNDQQAHYESLISTFKWMVSIATIFLTLVAGGLSFMTYNDGQEMRDELKERKSEMNLEVEKIKSSLKEEMINIKENLEADQELLMSSVERQSERVDKQIDQARIDATNQINNIKASSYVLAEIEAKRKISEVFQDKNIDKYIFDQAKNYMEPLINNMMDNRIDESYTATRESYITDLGGNDFTKIDLAIANLTTVNAGKLSENQTNRIIQYLNSGIVEPNYVSSYQGILIYKKYPESTKYFTSYLGNSLPEKYNSIFYLNKFEYDFNLIEQGILSNISKTENTDVYFEILFFYAYSNQAESLRYLNSQKLVSYIFLNMPREKIVHLHKQIKGNLSHFPKEKINATLFLSKFSEL